MRILVLGYIIRGPLGGLAWHHFQYVLGLHQMGCEVLFLEDSDSYPACYNPQTSEVNENPEYGLRFIRELFSAFDLNDKWAYFDEHTSTWYGQSKGQVHSFCNSAEIVLNISAVNPLREWWADIPCRVYIDTDPGFTQIKHLTDPAANKLASAHTCYISFAENINHLDCTIPRDGFNWLTTRQPVYLDAWKVSHAAHPAMWTTVMQWDSYKSRAYQGQNLGMKSLSFEPFTSLPGLLPGELFELALGSASAPVKELKEQGWRIISSLIPTKTPWSYQKYIGDSKAEWGVAKHGYVSTNSGWFSERSLCYMASGKPVLVQETGFSTVFETGKGVLSFSTLEQVLDGVERINSDYIFHCKRAREIVEANFDSQVVIKSLLNKVF